jgi:hypothetical protein
VLELLALEQAADTHCRPAIAGRDAVRAIAMRPVQGQDALAHGLERRLVRADSPVAHVADEAGVVPDGQHQPGVFLVQPAQFEVFGPQLPVHGAHV